MQYLGEDVVRAMYEEKKNEDYMKHPEKIIIDERSVTERMSRWII
jgi:hypothetical protein